MLGTDDDVHWEVWCYVLHRWETITENSRLEDEDFPPECSRHWKDTISLQQRCEFYQRRPFPPMHVVWLPHRIPWSILSSGYWRHAVSHVLSVSGWVSIGFILPPEKLLSISPWSFLRIGSRSITTFIRIKLSLVNEYYISCRFLVIVTV